MEYAVKDILSLSNADDYIPRFAQHKISIETMGKLTDEDLRRVGVVITKFENPFIKLCKSLQSFLLSKKLIFEYTSVYRWHVPFEQ